MHGMSDSPYSLRALGQRFHREGYHVVGLRLPGHGTVPSGLLKTTWKDMAAAVVMIGNTINTVSAVVRPAEPIMYIVPEDSPLVVTSRIEIIHIDKVNRAGQLCQGLVFIRK